MKKLFMIAIVGLALTGCASTATRNAVERTRQVDKAFGQVVDVYDADNRNLRNICKGLQNDAASQKICQHLEDYDVARTVVMRLNRFITWQVPVPKAANVKKESFLEFSPVHQLASFRRIVSSGPTSTCKWEGPSTYQFENSAAGVATGFVGGMLIVPTLIALGSDDALAGGVVCEDWSYKSLISDNVKS